MMPNDIATGVIYRVNLSLKTNDPVEAVSFKINPKHHGCNCMLVQVTKWGYDKN